MLTISMNIHRKNIDLEVSPSEAVHLEIISLFVVDVLCRVWKSDINPTHRALIEVGDRVFGFLNACL